MNRDTDAAIFMRTFDLPDIHFSEISGLSGDEKRFVAVRPADTGEIDSIALNRWFEQALTAKNTKTERDCWLQVDNTVFIAWGASVMARHVDGDNGKPVERWEFSYSELKKYGPADRYDW